MRRVQTVSWLCRALTVVVVLMGVGPASGEGPGEGARPPVDLNWKNPADQRAMRTIVLPNKLEVLLISDPAVKKASAAVDVSVGSLAEPDDQLGMAHFLEHVLFLGTKKFPKEGDYRSYLSAHQGYSNAYTALESTNYHLEVDQAAFEGAVERFSEFFVAPMFNGEFVGRERNAVESEYQKNLKDDTWRLAQLQKHFLRAGHPEGRFNIGSNVTLAKTTREQLVAFYKKYYSANVMKAVLISRDGIDRLEAMARKYFSAVPNFNRAKLTFEGNLFDAKALPRVIRVEPIKDLRQLVLHFEVPALKAFAATRPHGVLGHLLGHEGEGSLLSLLKAKGLATGLSAGAASNSYGGVMEVNVLLTEKGVRQYEEILHEVFGYLNLLRREGYKRFVFDELKTMGDLNYVFREFEDGADVASRYARLMQDFPAANIDKLLHTFEKYSEEDFRGLLDLLRPEKLQAYLVSRGLNYTDTEPYFKVRYGEEHVAAEKVKAWATAEPSAEVRYPVPNRYIPSNLTLLANDPHPGPYALLDEDFGRFVFEQDKVFHLPKARVEMLLVTPALAESPRNRLLGMIYERALAETLNEWKYPITLAELSVSVATEGRGVKLVLNGYSQHIPALLKDVLSKLRTIDISEERFAAIKDDVRRDLASQGLEPAFRQGLYELRHISEPLGFHYRSFEAMAPSVTLREVSDFAARKLYARIGVEGAAIGNLAGPELQGVVSQTHTLLGAARLAKAQWPKEDTIRLAGGHPVAYSMGSQDNNNAYLVYHVFGTHSPRASALTRLMDAYLSDKFFTELRTRQQLGYIVHSDRFANRTTQGLLFLIQSQTHESADVAERVNAWLAGAVKEAESLTDAELESFRRGIVSTLRQPDKTLEERIATIYSGAFVHNGDYDYRMKIAAATESVGKAELIAALRQLADPRTANYFAVYVAKDGAESAKPRPTETLLKDVELFRKRAQVWVLQNRF